MKKRNNELSKYLRCFKYSYVAQVQHVSYLSAVQVCTIDAIKMYA